MIESVIYWDLVQNCNHLHNITSHSEPCYVHEFTDILYSLFILLALFKQYISKVGHECFVVLLWAVFFHSSYFLLSYSKLELSQIHYYVLILPSHNKTILCTWQTIQRKHYYPDMKYDKYIFNTNILLSYRR